jgi:hypothetical protein
MPNQIYPTDLTPVGISGTQTSSSGEKGLSRDDFFNPAQALLSG